MQVKPRILAASMSAILAGALSAQARAGGGHGYHSVGHSSGGGGGFHSYPGSGGGGSGGSLSFPQIVLILIVILVIYYLRKKLGDRTKEKGFRATLDPGMQQSLRAAPPVATPASLALQAKLGQVFVAIQNAWSRGDMGPVRAVISDGVFHRFQIQLEMNKMQGIRNLAERPQLTGARLLKEERFGKYLSVDFLVRGRVHDRDVGAEGGATVSDNGSEEFEEIWSFTRLAEGAMGEPPLADGGDASSPQVLKALANCPKCAAPLSDAGGSRCGNCGAVLNSGAYDWVLAEITQAEEWAAGNRAELEGYYSALPVAAGTDARAWLSPQELEDRASVVFVRYQSALHRGNLSSLALFAAPELLQRLSGPGKEPPLYRLAVGAVDLSGFSAVAGLAKAWIRVKFSGARRPADEPEHQERVLVFSKSLDAAMGKNALSSLSCPACGGPLESTDQAKCAYCGAVLASPETNWVLCDYGGNVLLSQVMAPRALPDPAGNARPSAPAGPGAQFRLLSSMIAAALEDGVITAQEETTIRDFARNFGLGPIFVDTLLRKVKTDPGALNQAIGAQEALRWLNNFIMVAASDGVITAEEEALILAFARRQNLDVGKTRYALKAALRGKA